MIEMLKTTDTVLTKALMPFGPVELKRHIIFVFLLDVEQLFTTVYSWHEICMKIWKKRRKCFILKHMFILIEERQNVKQM